MNPIIHPIFLVIAIVLQIYFVILIIYVLVGWLYAFNVVSARNTIVSTIWNVSRRFSEPVIRPLRRLIPPIAGFDLSVLVVLLLLQFILGLLPWAEFAITRAVTGGP